MAYTFIVETGDNVPGSNSYVSVDEAADYLTQNIHVAATWDALPLDSKQRLLSWATRYLDQQGRWNGYKTYSDQSLRFPRTGVKDQDGTPLPPDEIPTQLKEAVIEMARFFLVSDRSAPRGQDGLKKLKVEEIELTFRDDYTLPVVPPQLNLILRGLGAILGNSTFAKIRRS
ncbi:MAG: hypothetical protein RIA09_15730 [Hoeflea sp.]|jgi:hypothetical protein|uniref:DnaT-like ssDNA-binding protein n=1 Tax=Hoeflea sp. TaxID=1940281 RepID=UPI0032ECBC79